MGLIHHYQQSNEPFAGALLNHPQDAKSPAPLPYPVKNEVREREAGLVIKRWCLCTDRAVAFVAVDQIPEGQNRVRRRPRNLRRLDGTFVDRSASKHTRHLLEQISLQLRRSCSEAERMFFNALNNTGLSPSRGEHQMSVVVRKCADSSQLTRGTPATISDVSNRIGLIPAHAGNTVVRG